MTEIIRIIILAVVQGIAEFLPISSSGHLAIVVETLEELFKFNLESGLNQLTVSVILHLGTLMSLLVFYWRTLLDIILKLRFKLAFLLIIASIPAAAAGVLLHDFFEDALSNLWVIGSMFILTAFLLITSQRFSKNKSKNDALAETSDFEGSTASIADNLSEVSWGQAIIIGIFQMFAILPGLSRSGSTIAGGLFAGLKQSAAANFSFLMAIPVIAGAGLLEVLKLIKNQQPIPITELSIGFFISFIVGLIALYWVINWVKKGKLNWFAYWLFLMAAFSFYLVLL